MVPPPKLPSSLFLTEGAATVVTSGRARFARYSTSVSKHVLRAVRLVQKVTKLPPRRLLIIAAGSRLRLHPALLLRVLSQFLKIRNDFMFSLTRVVPI